MTIKQGVALTAFFLMMASVSHAEMTNAAATGFSGWGSPNLGKYTTFAYYGSATNKLTVSGFSVNIPYGSIVNSFYFTARLLSVYQNSVKEAAGYVTFDGSTYNSPYSQFGSWYPYGDSVGSFSYGVCCFGAADNWGIPFPLNKDSPQGYILTPGNNQIVLTTVSIYVNYTVVPTTGIFQTSGSTAAPPTTGSTGVAPTTGTTAIRTTGTTAVQTTGTTAVRTTGTTAVHTTGTTAVRTTGTTAALPTTGTTAQQSAQTTGTTAVRTTGTGTTTAAAAQTTATTGVIPTTASTTGAGTTGAPQTTTGNGAQQTTGSTTAAAATTGEIPNTTTGVETTTGPAEDLSGGSAVAVQLLLSFMCTLLLVLAHLF